MGLAKPNWTRNEMMCFNLATSCFTRDLTIGGIVWNVNRTSFSEMMFQKALLRSTVNTFAKSGPIDFQFSYPFLFICHNSFSRVKAKLKTNYKIFRAIQIIRDTS